MEAEEYQTLFKIENKHWWYQGMRTITRAILQQWYTPGQNLHILDAGCGTGGAQKGYLSEFGEVIGLDRSRPALRYCQQRGLTRLVQATVTQLPFPNRSFDLITSMDVLYHAAVESDHSAIREMTRLLVPGGRLIIRLPAFECLRSHHDMAVHTSRRYTLSQVVELVKSSGLSIDLASYANCFLFPFIATKRVLERFHRQPLQGSDLAFEPFQHSRLLAGILGSEAAWITTTGLGFGLSVVVVGSK